VKESGVWPQRKQKAVLPGPCPELAGSSQLQGPWELQDYE
jgi:hypothetical protein